MQITSFGVLAVAVFVTQFILCVKKPRLIVRLIPTILLLAGLAVCGIVHAVNPASGAAFGAAVIGVLIGGLLVVDGAAWGATLLIPNKK